MNPVLLLHGALGSTEQLTELKSILENSGRKVFTLNFSGHGGVPFEDSFGIDQFADETLQFLSEHTLRQVDVFGYSMGGYVALHVALKVPTAFRRIITLGTKFDWTKESSAVEVKKLNPEKILEKIPAFAETLSRRHAPIDWKELMKQTAKMMIALGNYPLLNDENLTQIQHEVIIGLGDNDGMTSADFSEAVSKKIPNGKFILLKDTPHPIEKVNLESLSKLLVDHFR